MTEQVILVNESDQVIGTMEKLEAHERGVLHRAFSIFIFNDEGELLLQQRADEKYHCGNLWTNTCCSHPRPGEDLHTAALRRLQEEMGFVTNLDKAFHFTYRADFDNGLTEHEFDHVFTGTYNGPVIPDDREVKDYRFVQLDELKQHMQTHPTQYTPWFKIAFPQLEQYLASSSYTGI